MRPNQANRKSYGAHTQCMRRSSTTDIKHMHMMTTRDHLNSYIRSHRRTDIKMTLRTMPKGQEKKHSYILPNSPNPQKPLLT